MTTKKIKLPGNKNTKERRSLVLSVMYGFRLAGYRPRPVEIVDMFSIVFPSFYGYGGVNDRNIYNDLLELGYVLFVKTKKLNRLGIKATRFHRYKLTKHALRNKSIWYVPFEVEADFPIREPDNEESL